jgi:hypothetical protein
VQDAAGNEKVLFGCASYDGTADLLTVSTPSGQSEATQVACMPATVLAKGLLWEMFRKHDDAVQARPLSRTQKKDSADKLLPLNCRQLLLSSGQVKSLFCRAAN